MFTAWFVRAYVHKYIYIYYICFCNVCLLFHTYMCAFMCMYNCFFFIFQSYIILSRKEGKHPMINLFFFVIVFKVYLAMEAGYLEKVDELCERYSLEGFLNAKSTH